MTGSAIVAHRLDGVLEIRLDRPERRNALSRALLRSLREMVEPMPADVGAVVLSATGPVFSAGADFADLTGTPSDLEFDRELSAACTALRNAPVPTVAAVSGPCIGAAVELALSCDLRVAGPQACFRVPAVELGLLYNPESIRRMHATLPRATVTRMLLLAERFDAAASVEAGIATHRADPDARERALELARSIAALPKAAVGATRRLLRELDEGRYADSLWQKVRVELLASPERRSLVAAARQRHVPSASSRPTE